MSNNPLAGIRALAFDTGGTVFDWHGGLVRAFAQVGAQAGLAADWHAVTNDWRRRAMKGIVGQVHPDFHMDDVHLRTLHETLAHFGLDALGDDDRLALWSTWHRLQTWPDFAPALAALRQRLPVVSFTMLPVPLVVDVSRHNGIGWDAIVSCEMIGTYKPHQVTYATVARWLHLAPSDILMVACHNFDLNAAQDAGMATAFVRRPDEWGPEGPPDPHPNRDYTLVVDGFADLQREVLQALAHTGAASAA